MHMCVIKLSIVNVTQFIVNVITCADGISFHNSVNIALLKKKVV